VRQLCRLRSFAQFGGRGAGLSRDAAGQRYDPDVFRVFLEIISLLALPEDILGRPGFSERLAKSAAGKEAFEIPGPARKDLLQSLA